ncbi:MAG: hypothetical protein ACI875_000082 [Planctomycetota bacterium]
MEKQIKPRRYRLLRRFFAVFGGIILACIGLVVFLSTTGVDAPDWVRARVESQLSQAYPSGEISIDAISLAPLTDGLTPKIDIRNIELRGPDGNLQASVPAVEASFSALGLLSGQLQPITVLVKGANLNLKRDQDGQFDITVGGASDDLDGTPANIKSVGSVADIMAQIDSLLAIPILKNLKEIESTQSSLSLDDALSGHAWNIDKGVVSFEQNDTEITASVRFNLTDKLDQDADDAAWANFSWRKEKGADVSEISTWFHNIRAEDIADQVTAFNWLRLLDAPISGSMALDVSSDGMFGDMHGVLDVGTGIIRQTEKGQPIRFTSAKAYLSYDQNLEKFTFDQVLVNTDAAQITANGHIYLSDLIDRTVGAVITQLRFTKVTIDPPGVFTSSVKFDLGALDARIQLDPLTIDIGQLVLVDGDTRLVASGNIAFTEAGFAPTIDLSVNSIPALQMVQLWPLVYKPKSKAWMDKYILGGVIHNVTGALRGAAGEKPVLNLGFDMRDMNVKFMKTLPPLENGVGYAVLADGTMDFVLESGNITAPDGGKINVAGTVFQILNTRIKGSPAVVQLKSQSSISSLLSVLDLPPFEFLSKAGLETDLAAGTIATKGKISFPMVKKVPLDLVTYALEGKAKNVSTSKLVKGKVLKADALKVVADNSGITISGEARLGRVPVSGLWRQDTGPLNKGKSKVEGQVELSQRFLDEFAIALPKGSIKGRGTGHIEIDLVRDKPAQFKLVSDLNRVQLAITALGWSKPKNMKAKFSAEGQFGTPTKITSISLKTRGLDAKGTITLNSDGTLDVARFDQVNLDDWVKTPVEIRNDANGNAVFNLNGGLLDFRKSRFGSSGSDGSGNLIAVKIDRLIVSNGIALTDVVGDLNTSGGVTGSFSGRVNGGARIIGTLAPYNGGTGVRFTSTDAGSVFRSSGLFNGAHGGRMDMILVPAGKPGHYNGTMSASKLRVQDASALAAILSALSVVGLLEQLDGEGIAFSNVDAKFLLTPNGVQLHEGSAVGASLGLTMEGAYQAADASMDMRGVITPVYLLNGILEQTKIFGGLFGKKKGEGLLGFNYTLKGNADTPKVGVNPLSILAPGVLRDIFRTPTPQVSDE